MKKERFYRSQNQFQHYRLQFQFLNFHRLSMTGPYEYPSHQHSNFELILVKNGPYRCNLNDEDLSVDQDCALLIQPGDIHQDHLKANQIHYVVHFQILTTPGSQSVERILRKGCSANQQVARMPSPNDDSWLDEIASESEGNLYSGNIQDALLEVIVWRILRHFPQTLFDGVFFQHTAARQFVETVYAMISSHLYERFTVSALASKMEVSERTLTSKCSEILHESPATIIRTLKIEEAKRLLRIGNPTVKEVAYHLGYSNPFHFSQVFKNATGITPKSWRSEQVNTL